MDIIIKPQLLKGHISAPASKSMAHRLLICAALADAPTHIVCDDFGQDIAATAACLQALGADIQITNAGFCVTPITALPNSAVLHCRESGSTLRFLLPIVGALAVNATFTMEGRLPQRPLSPLWEEMERMGCRLSRPTANTIACSGKLRPGAYCIDGSVSSQFITGLLFALSILGESTLRITGIPVSEPYISMTKQALALFGAPDYHSPGSIRVESDWSNAAFWLAANALGCHIQLDQLDTASCQGDKKILTLLEELRHFATICVEDIPDLVPILSIVAANNKGAVFTNIQRLRTKESDRVAATVAMIRSLGGQAEADDDHLTIHGTGLIGGTVDSFHDHRIAMSAAIASTICKEQVTILDAECVDKSYPKFWEDYCRLGGNYDQYLR